MSLAILIPMLGRPHTVAPLLESIRETVPDARVLFLITDGDADVAGAIYAASGSDRLVFNEPFPPRARGDYAAKINAGIAATTEEHIFTGACDLRFQPGWYEAAVAKLADGIGLVGTNDLSPRGDTLPGVKAATHFLATRKYCERGTIDGQPGLFFEGYVHEWCDTEAIETAAYRNAYAYAEDSVVEHLHPAWSKAEWDPMYRRMGERIRQSRPLFERRRRLWS